MSARRTLFDDLAADVHAEVVAAFRRERFAAGSVVVAEGDATRTIFVVQSGSAQVYVADQRGVEQAVGRIGPGGTIGEMAAFTGQPATATVRAESEIEVLVLDEGDIEDLADRHPVLYRNLGAILADRLARTSRLAARRRAGRVVFLHDDGAPVLLAYALAASVAWHTRAPTLLVVLDEAAASELDRLDSVVTPVAALAERSGVREARLDLFLAAAARGFTSHSISFSLDDLALRYEHVLVHSRGEVPLLAEARRVELAGMGGQAAAGELVVRGWGPAPARRGADEHGVVTVPEPDDGALDELRAGRLSARTATGRAAGWAARDIAGLKVGLALGAGSFRGYAHVGVIQVLQRHGLTVDCVSGTSIGAAVGGMHALGIEPHEMIRTLDACARAVFRPTLPVKSFLSSRALAALMRTFSHGRRLEDLPLPFAAVAADLGTAQEVVLRRGDLALAVTASISIPGIYPAQRVGPYTLVDGGVLDPVPVAVLGEMGADHAIGVKLGGPPHEWIADAIASAGRGSTPTALPLILRSIEIMQARIASAPTVPTVFLSPDFAGIEPAGLRRFKANGRLYLERGLEAAEGALPRLEAAFPWIRP